MNPLSPSEEQARKRRTAVLAWAHLGVVLLILAAFVWKQASA